jgi:O-antigen/teichoic acid export membrane protein
MVVLNVVFIIIIPKQDGIANSNPSFIINLYFAYFVLTGLVLTTAFILKNKSWQNFSFPDFASLRLLIRYAIMALAANIIFFLVYRIDYWFVNKYCSAEELGNYIQVSKLAQMLLIIPTIISSVVFPHTAGGMDLAKMKDNIFRIGRFTTILYAILFIVVLAVGNFLFPLIFGETYQLMNVPFLILIPGIWALSNLFILSAYFGGVNKVKVNIMGACVGLVLILAGDLIFIPHYGMYAAAIVSTVGYMATFLFSFSHIRKEYAVSITQYLSIKKDDIKWLQQVIKR